jgi:hypothetical protein
VDYWSSLSSTHRHQYEVYVEGRKFDSYFVYRSNPGFQGVLYGGLDKLFDFPGEQKIRIFRWFTATLSALTCGLIFSFIAMEFGLLAGILTLVFSAVSIWTVLPAGSIFWNLWVFYFPFLAGTALLADAVQTGSYSPFKIHVTMFITILVRILLSGFDMMTTVLIMSTVPFVFYGIYANWGWKILIERFVKISIALSAGTLAGLMIMSAQIASVDKSGTNVLSYISSRFGHHFAGNEQYYTSENIQATRIGIAEVTEKYLVMPAINVRLPGPDTQILYWQLVVLFVLATILYFIFHKKQGGYPRKAIALIVTTWYSFLAPLSWYIIFRPHSIIHTHVNTIGWQMPFTLLGFALCGFVIADLFGKKTA